MAGTTTKPLAFFCALAVAGTGCGSGDDAAEDAGAAIDAAPRDAQEGAADAAGSGIDAAQPDAAPGSDDLYDDLDAELQELFDLINEERADEGLEEVSLRHELLCAAEDISEAAADENECAAEIDGVGPGQRVESCGGDRWSAVSLGCGPAAPDEVVEGWLEDEDNEEILLGEDRVHVGVGVHENHWTAIYDDG